MNRRCLFIFMSIGSRRKESEISGIYLFLLTHLNHELTRAAYELRVWVRAHAQLKTLSSLLNTNPQRFDLRLNIVLGLTGVIRPKKLYLLLSQS